MSKPVTLADIPVKDLAEELRSRAKRCEQLFDEFALRARSDHKNYSSTLAATATGTLVFSQLAIALEAFIPEEPQTEERKLDLGDG